MRQKLSRPLLLAAAVFAGGIGFQPAAAKTLVYNAYIPSTHTLLTEGVEPWMKAIEERTDGSVTFDMFAGGALASGKTTLNAIRTGAIDAGAIVDLYTPSDLPISTMLSDLFLFGKDPWVMAAAMNETVLLDCEACREDYVEEKILPLGFVSTPSYLLQCKEPVTRLEQVHGNKIRATGAMGVLAASLGGTAVNITSSEIYEAMQRGQVDCFMGAGAWLENYALAEVTNYVTDLPLGTYHGSLLYDLNTESWEDLEESEKKVILEATPHAIRAAMEAYTADEEEAKALSKEKGVEWLEPEEGLKQAVAEARSKEAERVAGVARDRGVENPEQMIEIFLDNVEKWTGIMADIGDDYDQYEAALKREIFDKVSY